jgi:hypothetical protein
MMQHAAPMSQSGSEQIYGAIVLRKPKSLGRWDTWTGVITSQRFIFAQMTEAMVNAAVQQSRDQAKAEGKGFWGQWADQLKATWGYTRRYLGMQPQAILAETPGNFAIDNAGINEIKVKLKYERDSNVVHELELQIHSNMGNFDFHIDENSNTTDLLKKVYDGRVKMPLGYFSKSINIGF